MTVHIDESWYMRPPEARSSASTGGAVVRVEAGQIWVALVREPEYNTYILPKGRLEPGESLEAAARREIEEEAGLSDLTHLGELGVQERLNFKKDEWKVITYFLFQTHQKVGVPTDPKHIYECEWFPLESLPRMFWPEQRRLLEEKREWIEEAVRKAQ